MYKKMTDITRIKSTALAYYVRRCKTWQKRHNKTKKMFCLFSLFTIASLILFFVFDCHQMQNLTLAGFIGSCVLGSFGFVLLSMLLGWLCEWREESNYLAYQNLLPKNNN
jgi:hypothetical protein